MEAIELKKLMQDYNHKLDDLIQLNEAAVKSLSLKKTEKKTSRLLLNRLLEMVAFSFIVIYMGSFLTRHWGENHLVISALVVELFAIVALIGSIGQIFLIKRIDYSLPVVEIKKRIEMVNAHGFLFLKLLLFSLPVWWAYAILGLYLFLGVDVYLYLSPGFVSNYLIVNGLLVFPLVWLFHKLSYRNLHIVWVRRIIKSLTSRKTQKALESLKKIDQFEHSQK